MSKRIVEYDRFIRSASHVNIYALLVFFSLVSRFIRSISALVSVTRSFAFYYLCAHSCVSGILYVFTLLAACTCALFCRWFLGEWESERVLVLNSMRYKIYCVFRYMNRRGLLSFITIFSIWTALKMNTNSLYGLAHSIYTYITKLLLSIVFWIFWKKKNQRGGKNTYFAIVSVLFLQSLRLFSILIL